MLNLQEVSIKNIDFEQNFIHLWINTSPKVHICPSCKHPVSNIHDYRQRTIKHIMIGNRQSILHLNQRRYVCSHCGKKFSEHYDFVSKYYRNSNDVVNNIFDDLKRQLNFKTIALNNGITSQSVIRLMQFHIPFKVVKELPQAIGIDEFRGNSGGNKFQVAITDLKTHKIIDIISARTEDAIYHYLNSITNKDSVKFITIDLSVFFKRIILDNFKNATIIADKFHYTRLINWALDKVRKKVQTGLDKDMRIFFKHSKNILHKRFSNLTPDEYNQLTAMLDYDEELRWAYSIKEKLYEINDEKDFNTKVKLFKEWLLYSQNCGLIEFKGHLDTFFKWHKYIINSFKYSYTNGITEGLNTKIKTLKRISYGFRNFNNFRLRILLCA
jgi:transposase